MGTGIVVALVVIALILLLVWSLRRPKPVAAAPALGPRRTLTTEEVSSVLQETLRSVNDAVERCKAANAADKGSADKELAAARLHLDRTVTDQLAKTRALVRDGEASPRFRRMIGLNSAEIMELTAPWMSLKPLVSRGVPLSQEEMSNAQRLMWTRAEFLIATHVASGGSPETKAQLERLPQQLKADVEVMPEGNSERQRLMWTLAVEEICSFVDDALNAAGSGQERAE